mmetsp:Transcript_76051/g.199480  ORF Transcript_76051/g.199480 Transcript_76051/m.199480 type:complete len:209 (-) Transcript_76051:354-980(-)
MTPSEPVNHRRISIWQIMPHMHGSAPSSLTLGVAPAGHTAALSPSTTRHRPDRASRWIRAKSVSRLIGSLTISASSSRWDTEEMIKSMPRCAELNMIITLLNFSTTKMAGISVVSSTTTKTTVYVGSFLEPMSLTDRGERSSKRTRATAIADMMPEVRSAGPVFPTRYATSMQTTADIMPTIVGTAASLRSWGMPMKLSCSSWCSCMM